MSAVFPRERIRLRVNTAEKAGFTGITDQVTGASPDCWKGTAVQFEIGLFISFNDTATELLDITNIQAMTLLAKPAENVNGDVILEKSISAGAMDPTLTQEAWDAGTGQHATIEFTAAEMNIALNGQTSRDLFLILHGLNTDGEPMVFGAAKLRVYETGILTGGPAAPVLGGNRIPSGSVYDGSGNFDYTVVSGQIYQWTKGANDSTIVNGTETLSASGNFTAQGTSVTLTGTPAALVTANLRDEVFLTAGQTISLIEGSKVINGPGVTTSWQSPNERFIRVFGVTDDGDRFDQIIDRNA